MVLTDVYDQLVLFLPHLHEDDHKDSSQIHELLDVFLTNVFYQLFRFELKKNHCC